MERNNMNVLSLFDGKSGAMAALQAIGIKPTNYYACEIDKYAQAVSRYHYPDIIRLGDVTKVTGADLPKIDLLVAGYPCQSFSVVGKQLNFDYPRGKLFFEVIRLIKETKPKYFLLENVKMKKEWQDIISNFLGVEPILINSALLSAQNRKRLYWANFPITQPEDKGILLKDIIDGDAMIKSHGEYKLKNNKAQCLDANYHRGIDNHGQRTVILQISPAGKCPTLSTMQGGHREPKIVINDVHWRKLTPLECEKLQTFEDGYTEYGIDEKGNQITISNSQRYKMLGNGFTRDVIAHIFQYIT